MEQLSHVIIISLSGSHQLTVKYDKPFHLEQRKVFFFSKEPKVSGPAMWHKQDGMTSNSREEGEEKPHSDFVSSALMVMRQTD